VCASRGTELDAAGLVAHDIGALGEVFCGGSGASRFRSPTSERDFASTETGPARSVSAHRRRPVGDGDRAHLESDGIAVEVVAVVVVSKTNFTGFGETFGVFEHEARATGEVGIGRR